MPVEVVRSHHRNSEPGDVHHPGAGGAVKFIGHGAKEEQRRDGAEAEEEHGKSPLNW